MRNPGNPETPGTEPGGLNPMTRVRSPVGHVYGDPHRAGADRRDSGSIPSSPAVDVRENDLRVHVSIDVPGFGPDDVELTVREDALVVEGSREAQLEEEDGWLRRERASGHFRRRIDLPAKIDLERASASVRDGVLDVILPKQESERRPFRRLEIR